MGVVKSLWASVQGDPVFMRRVNGWLAVFWVFMIPVSLYTGWEVTQQQEERARDKEDLAGDVVEQVIEKTDLDRAEPS